MWLRGEEFISHALPPFDGGVGEVEDNAEILKHQH